MHLAGFVKSLFLRICENEGLFAQNTNFHPNPLDFHTQNFIFPLQRISILIRIYELRSTMIYSQKNQIP